VGGWGRGITESYYTRQPPPLLPPPPLLLPLPLLTWLLLLPAHILVAAHASSTSLLLLLSLHITSQTLHGDEDQYRTD